MLQIKFIFFEKSESEWINLFLPNPQYNRFSFLWPFFPEFAKNLIIRNFESLSPKIMGLSRKLDKINKEMCSSLPTKGIVTVGFNLWEGTLDVLKSKMANF